MKIIFFLFLLAVMGAPLGSLFAITGSVSHQNYSEKLDRATEWTQHLKSEVKKGKKMNQAHVINELQGARDALTAMNDIYSQIAKEAPGDVNEGHFVALKTIQEKSFKLLSELEVENRKSDRSISKMRSVTTKLLNNLEEARHEHQLELLEMEQHPSKSP